MEENEQLKSFLNELKEKVQWLEKEKKNVMKDVKIKEADFKLLSKEHKKVVLLMFFSCFDPKQTFWLQEIRSNCSCHSCNLTSSSWQEM